MFVAFPQWFNQLLEEMWPYYDKAIGKAIKEVVEPLMDEYKPPGLIKKIFFKNLTFGDAPMRAEHVWVEEKGSAHVLFEVKPAWLTKMLGGGGGGRWKDTGRESRGRGRGREVRVARGKEKAVHMHAPGCAHTHTDARTHALTCTATHRQRHTHTHTHTRARARARRHTRTQCTHTRTHAHTTHTHTHTHTERDTLARMPCVSPPRYMFMSICVVTPRSCC
jgi:hypothetical protein